MYMLILICFLTHLPVDVYMFIAFPPCLKCIEQGIMYFFFFMLFIVNIQLI